MKLKQSYRDIATNRESDDKIFYLCNTNASILTKQDSYKISD